MTLRWCSQRLLAFDYLELPIDINGIPAGPNYVPFLTIDEMRSYRSLRGGLQGVWSSRMHQLGALEEIHAFMALEANPYIMDVREGYPIATPDVVHDIMDGRPVSRNRVMTIDFIITLRPRNFGGPLRYMGLSVKPANIAERPRGKRRAQKEEGRLNDIGWEWDYVTIPSAIKVANLIKLRHWAKAYPLDDAVRDAAQLAALFYTTTSTKDLDGQLAMLGRRLGIAREDQYFVFAGAFYLGFLSLNHEYKLDEHRLPVLQSPARTMGGWQ